MHVRKITRVSRGSGIVLPHEVLTRLGIIRGDYVAVQVIDETHFLITKIIPPKDVNLHMLSRMELPDIQYGK